MARLSDCCPEKDHYARGMCKTHYREWQRRKNGIGVPVDKRCLVCLEPFKSLWGMIYCGIQCKRVASKWMNRFGMSPQDYYGKLKDQNGCCATCFVTEPGADRKFFDVDHCHEKNIVRGLLCRQCNVILGYCKDNAKTLRALADYLER